MEFREIAAIERIHESDIRRKMLVNGNIKIEGKQNHYFKMRGIIFLTFLFVQQYSYSQEYVVSIDDRNKAVELTNQAANCINNKNATEAFYLLTKAISIDSTIRTPFLHLFSVFTLNKNYSTVVVANLKKAKRIFKQDDEISYYLGEVYRGNSEEENAIKEYSNAIEYSKSNGEDFPMVKYYYLNRGNCYIKLNNIDSALADYNNTLRLDTNNTSALINRGICYFKKGKQIEACQDWNKSKIFGSTLADVYIEKYCGKN